MRGRDGYRAVLAERSIRRLLAASLAGRVGFLMLPLGLIFLAETAARAGALIAAFSIASALTPARGRVVDRHGARALTAFALACGVFTWALVAASLLHAPTAVLVAMSALVGLVAPPLGPFTRAAYGRMLDETLRQRTFALDSAGEEGAVIVAPLLAALLAGLLSPEAAVAIAAGALLAGSVATAGAAPEPGPKPTTHARRVSLPASLWLLYAALACTAAALGAIDISLPAVARENDHFSAAGVLFAVMAIGTVAGSLLAGRRSWSISPQWRIAALTALMGAGIALTATMTSRLPLLGAALLIPGLLLGALFATAYVLADRLAPPGSGTRTFAWLVTANNGGIALGAAGAGALAEGSGAAAGLWLGAACAFAGTVPAAAAAVMSVRVLK
ncbi:MFS transporter [Solirubrobacter ginsenosidimutans]|uniref:MFS transporter n=1 Tax=Solirubrobacter ginsenosidimutans TaxID=490573 RepID=A0A9X3MYQ5_9ACTN|nr:MFS transporter [Solirubrobacter ginsenosidimutans]MDA0165235.1 MFS transporter [Solirubrobacter ginsenosidimutans]